MSSAMLNTLGNPLKILSTFLWNLLPAGAVPKVILMNLYLPNLHTNVVKYKDFLIKFYVVIPLTGIKTIM